MSCITRIVGKSSKNFEALDNIEWASFVLGCEFLDRKFEFYACFSEGVHNQFVGG